MQMAKTKELTAIAPTSNGAEETITLSLPYIAAVEIVGVADILFHAWNNEAVASKAKAPKGSKAKKDDNLESYVYRTDTGELGVPGECFRQSLIEIGRYRQDPRSPRKSARDLFKAILICYTPIASLGVRAWDYESRLRALVQRQAITRVRPAMKEGWTLSYQLGVLAPEYLQPAQLHEVITNAGRFCGLCDFRPSYGRFQVTRFEVLDLE
jgi:hypothetical protein